MPQYSRASWMPSSFALIGLVAMVAASPYADELVARAGFDAMPTALPAVSAPPPFDELGPLDLELGDGLDSAAFDRQLQVVTEGKLAAGQTLGQALRGHGIDPSIIHLITKEMRPSFDFRRSQPGHRYRLSQDVDGGVLAFRYTDREDSSLHLMRTPAGYRVSRESTQYESRVTRLSGVIHTTLYQAILDAGGEAALASRFAEIFAWDLDFARGVHAGDDFQILYERLVRTDDDGKEVYVRPGQILAAHYGGVPGDFSAVYFDESGEGAGTYFRPDGTAIERHFLVAPLRYSRISSTYSSARPHPILKVTRPHHGIDYAAPKGTPVWSVADGTVSYVDWAGGFGKLVKVRHVNGYVSYYSHLSRFVTGLRVGQQVRQKQVIGYVGKTGLATGSHICFRVAKDGQYVNPMSLVGPLAMPLQIQSWTEFKTVRDQLLSRLQLRSETLVDEAL